MEAGCRLSILPDAPRGKDADTAIEEELCSQMAQGPGASLLGNDMLNRAQLAPLGR